MSKLPVIGLLIATQMSPVPAYADVDPQIATWLTTLPNKERQWKDCPLVDLSTAIAGIRAPGELDVRVDAVRKAYERNPYFGFSLPKSQPFDCKAIGPISFRNRANVGSGPRWFVQHIRYLVPKACAGEDCSRTKGECEEYQYCKVEGVRICALELVGKANVEGPYFRSIMGPLGCERLSSDELPLFDRRPL